MIRNSNPTLQRIDIRTKITTLKYGKNHAIIRKMETIRPAKIPDIEQIRSLIITMLSEDGCYIEVWRISIVRSEISSFAAMGMR